MSLSDEVRSECHGDNRCYCDGGTVIQTDDVKQFIKELKEVRCETCRCGICETMKKRIDELAGEELI